MVGGKKGVSLRFGTTMRQGFARVKQLLGIGDEYEKTLRVPDWPKRPKQEFLNQAFGLAC
jgi:hypothetical protein